VPQKFQAQIIYFSYKDRSGPTKTERPADHL
jgi:hypothetical protein